MKQKLKVTRLVASLAWFALAGTSAWGQQAQTTSTASTTTTSQVQKKTDAVKLNTVVVTDTALSAEDEAQAQLDTIPGAVSLIKGDKVSGRRAATTEDLLSFQPGVYAKSSGGNDTMRISIRGSGINRAPGSFKEGTTFLFDGMPLTGTGGTPPELFEPLGLSYTEVLKGANAWQYGGLSTGGAVNYVTQTGETSHPLEVRYDAGSFGYNKEYVASGGVIGDLDYYVAEIGTIRQGFQHFSKTQSLRNIANLGYKISDDIETRIYFRFAQSDFQQPGNTSVAQILKDPTAANPNNEKYQTGRRNTGSEWVAQKTTIRIDEDSKLETGIGYHNYPIWIYNAYGTIGGGGGLGQGQYQNTSEWNDADVNFAATYTRNDDLGGLQSKSTFGYYETSTVYGSVWTRRQVDNFYVKKAYYGGQNQTLLASNELEVYKDLWFNTAAQGVYVERDAQIRYPVSKDYTHEFLTVNPRVGLRYDLNPNVQFFGNLSRTTEPADNWKYVSSAGSNWNLTNFVDLDEQIAQTVEVGSRFKDDDGIFEGSLGLYRSRITHELLTVNYAAQNTNTNYNSSTPTIHQGVEAGLKTTLWKEKVQKSKGINELNDPKAISGGNGGANEENPHQITLNQAYTYNDFFIKGDKSYGYNSLPGIPTHVYQTELLYEHSSGFYAGFNADIESNYYADYNNTYLVPSYIIYGAKIGFNDRKHGWETYLQFNNLTNEKYVTSIAPQVTANANTAAYQPGDGFGVFGGVSYKY